MRRTKALLAIAGLVCFWTWPCACAGEGPIIIIESNPVLSISDETGSFTLIFPNFISGTVSTAQTVLYRVQANNMTPGLVPGAVSARLQETMEGIDLEADVNGYQNLGNSTFARLQEAQSGYRVVQVSETALADKTAGTGGGDVSLDGNLTVTWRARLTAPAAAGQRSQFLVVTLKEGV